MHKQIYTTKGENIRSSCLNIKTFWTGENWSSTFWILTNQTKIGKDNINSSQIISTIQEFYQIILRFDIIMNQLVTTKSFKT